MRSRLCRRNTECPSSFGMSRARRMTRSAEIMQLGLGTTKSRISRGRGLLEREIAALFVRRKMGNKSYNVISETDDAVAGLVGSLPRVEAPGDFVRAFALNTAGRPATTSWTPAFAGVAVSLALLLLALGGYFGLQRSLSIATCTVTGCPDTVGTCAHRRRSTMLLQCGARKRDGRRCSAAAAGRRELDPHSEQTDFILRLYSWTGPVAVLMKTLVALQTVFCREVLSPDTQNMNSPDDEKRVISTKRCVWNPQDQAGYTPEGWKVGVRHAEQHGRPLGCKAGDVVRALNDSH